MANAEVEEVDYGAEEDEEMVAEDREEQPASAQPKLRYCQGRRVSTLSLAFHCPLHSSDSASLFLR